MTTIRINGQDIEVKAIHPHNAHLARQYLTKFDPETNTFIAWDDATDVEVLYATDEQGNDPIASMGPFPMAAMDAGALPGWYYRIVPSSVTALLDTAALRGTRIWQLVTGGSNDEFRVATPFVVTEPRYAE